MDWNEKHGYSNMKKNIAKLFPFTSYCLFSKMNIPYLNDLFLSSNIDYTELIRALDDGFAATDIHTPLRHHHDYGPNQTLLLMPSWQKEKDLGLKLVSVNPNNQEMKLPSIHGIYVYMDYHTGVPICLLDAKALTSIRTAASSVLASTYLARKESSSLLVLGTGAMIPKIVKAYTSLFPIKEVFIWGRNSSKAQNIIASLGDEIKNQFKIRAIENYDSIISQAAIISAATLSREPLIAGKQLVEGQHIDLIGSYKNDMREADDDVMRISKIYVDSYEGALTESGDLSIPLQNNVIGRSDIQASLFELCSKTKPGRNNPDDITVFKSVGHALEDLVAARYFYNKYLKKENSELV